MDVKLRAILLNTSYFMQYRPTQGQRELYILLIKHTEEACSVHLCLFFYFAYRVIITIFLNSIYMLVYCNGLHLSGLLHSV